MKVKDIVYSILGAIFLLGNISLFSNFPECFSEGVDPDTVVFWVWLIILTIDVYILLMGGICLAIHITMTDFFDRIWNKKIF